MPLGISDEHLALHEAVAGWAARHCPPAVPRALLDAPAEDLPPFWADLAALGWLGIHVPEQYGGDGYGLAELTVVLEELGRVCAPGPFLPTVLAAAVIAQAGDDEQRAALLPGIVRGETPAAVAWHGRPLDGDLSGTLPAVLGGALAELVVAPALVDGDEVWVVVGREDVTAVPSASVDRTRRVATLEVRASASAFGGRGRILRGPSPVAVPDLAALLLSAEATGAAGWCVDTAADHAKVREQFGRPIGQFQAVKHRCADMLLALEQARAAVWDAARACDESGGEGALAVAVAAALAPEAAFKAAKDCIQVLGGIGFTWEHDAHLYLKRATATRLLLGGPHPWRRRAADLARAGARRTLRVDLPADADGHRAEARAFLAGLREQDASTWRPAMAASGYIAPHWPRPWGRDASPLEQLVIDEEFRSARVRRPHLAVGAWALPTLVAHGSPAQQERFIPPTLRGGLAWCQMFSEPGAGSDLASLTTKASRVEGGWLLTGQKVWTSMAREADWAICLARTDPTAPKHEGITCFLVDMRSDGIDIRPLRELTGAEMFNEVFLDDVFVPDECVVGGPGDGWRCARTTLENERVSMGSGSSFGNGVEAVLALLGAAGDRDTDPAVVDEVGALVADAQSLAALGLRLTLRALSGAEPGPESSVRKLLGVEHDQRVQEVGLTMLGAAGASADGEAARWLAGFLGNRCLTIAGGTSEVQRNVIAERLLGLPRDP